MSIEDEEQIIIIDEDERTNSNDLIEDKEIIVDIKEEEMNKINKINKNIKNIKKSKCKKIYEYIQRLIYCDGCHSCNGFSISVCLTVSIIWIIMLMLAYY